MRINLLVTAALLLAWTSVLGQDNLFTPMKGSATPEFQMSDATGRCLVFGRHVVKITQSEDGGENVMMWNREGTAKGAAACQLRARPYATIKDSDNNSFYGISAVYFFIDLGTSAGSRTLLVYKTDSGNEVTRVGYFGAGNEPRIEAARYLFYDAVSSRKGPISTCPEAAKWKRQGGGVAWVQGKKLDLDTQTATNIGSLRCVYEE
jgi:hypothetical protein